MRKWHGPLACALLLLGCTRYGSFTLPAPEGSPTPVAYRATWSPTPLLSRGNPGEWDAIDVLNPSVVLHQGRYINFYSGFDGRTWHTGLATSPDGLAWQKQGKVLSPQPDTWEGAYIAANGSALWHENRFWYWYQAGNREPRIGLARSPDGRTWEREPQPVLPLGPRGSWDERGVADPYVIRADDAFYLYYLGQDRARRQRLGVARSTDGIHWTKLRANPVLEVGEPGAFDENGLGEPAVWLDRGRYRMLYTGRDRREVRRLGFAHSRDGVTWERAPASSVLEGQQPWNAEVVCDPTVLSRDGRWWVWYGGGDIAKPDERLNGQVGLLWLER